MSASTTLMPRRLKRSETADFPEPIPPVIPTTNIHSCSAKNDGEHPIMREQRDPARDREERSEWNWLARSLDEQITTAEHDTHHRRNQHDHRQGLPTEPR